MNARRPIPTVEQEHPRLWWLYAAAFVGAIALSALAGCGGCDDPAETPDKTIDPPSCAASSACH